MKSSASFWIWRGMAYEMFVPNSYCIFSSIYGSYIMAIGLLWLLVLVFLG